VWLQACLNGSRTRDEHPAVPLTPDELAADAATVQRLGATSVHVHPRDVEGRESLAPADVAAAVAAIRGAAPGLPVGVSTAADIEPDLERRIAAIDAWTVVPDFVSLNLAEPGWERVLEALTRRGIGLEAGLWAAADARSLLLHPEAAWLRLLLEPWEEVAGTALAIVETLERLLEGTLPAVPRLVHGTDAAAWPLLARAKQAGRASRIGLEDTLSLPSGETAADNAALLQAAMDLRPG
jgi:uncharacterized protein (DUF849 family)